MWRALVGAAVVFILAAVAAAGISALAFRTFGPPAAWLKPIEVIEYSAKVLWADGLLTRPLDPAGHDRAFEISAGESVGSVCMRLEIQGFVRDAGALRDYLIYSGQDTTLQAGRFLLSPAMSAIELSRRLQDSTPTDVEFVVLAGWRIEEIAAALPTSGFQFPEAQFLQAARTAPRGFDFLEGAKTAEGFLHPGSYILPRRSTSTELVEELIRGFAAQLHPELREGFTRQGLSVYEAVILASIVQREAVRPEESPMIASVYLNRLRAGMRLEADPTVQYAVGFNPLQKTWWTNPLSLEDLRLQSPFNTYQVNGLPPAPISNPGQVALSAVASPAGSDYLFFSARCDGSGFHNFTTSFDEHLAMLCP